MTNSKTNNIKNGDREIFFLSSASSFEKITGSPIAYWVSDNLAKQFVSKKSISDVGRPRQGLASTNNGLFYRYWHEVDFSNIGLGIESRIKAIEGKFKWFPLNKGGSFRRWAGNNEWVINFENDGKTICDYIDNTPGAKVGSNGRVINREFYFQPGISYSDLTTGGFGARYFGHGFVFDTTGPSIFDEGNYGIKRLLAYVNTKLFQAMLDTVCTGLHYSNGVLAGLPVHFPESHGEIICANTDALIDLSRTDWNSFEISWDFTDLPLLHFSHRQPTLKASYQSLRVHWCEVTLRMQKLEQENNRIFIDAHGLQDELTHDVPLEEITLTCNPHYRYGGNKTNEELETMLQCDTMEELVSYAIGCMMGRYSLDKPGLILASQGETLQDYLSQIPSPRFVPDDDGILPLTDQEWFADDATNRFREFVRTAWGEQTLQENLDFVARSLCLQAIKPKKCEDSVDTIRRYLSSQFHKDHLRTYKKRPIYWLFSSGRHKAFECLVYLHRYNEGTLARMRTEYVIPLTAKLNAHANKLEKDIDASTSTAEKKALEKQLASLHNQQAELATFDEKLRHFADQRIHLNLDDGVKVNYGKFGDLLAEVNAITGGPDE